MITHYVIATSEDSARATLNVYLSLTDPDRKASRRVHDTEPEAREALAGLRTDPDRDCHDRAWADTCAVWSLSHVYSRLPEE